MAGSVNKVILVGRLGQDPETRGEGEKQVVKLSLATSFKSGDKEHTEWHDVVAFGKLGGMAASYLVKGRLVYVEGRLRNNTWTDQEGQKRRHTEVVATNITFLDSAKAESGEPEEEEPGDVPF